MEENYFNHSKDQALINIGGHDIRVSDVGVMCLSMGSMAIEDVMYLVSTLPTEYADGVMQTYQKCISIYKLVHSLSEE